MSVAIGKIVASDSHLFYHTRVFDTSEVENPPSRFDYAFGSFVSISSPTEQLRAAENEKAESVIGIVSNSRLINPESAYYGPRLTVPQEQNKIFAPDYINEVGVMLSVLLLGSLTTKGGLQGVPPFVLPVGCEVRTATEQQIKAFHRDSEGRFQMRYYPLLSECGPALSPALLQKVCDSLSSVATPDERRILNVIRKNMTWQSTLGMVR